MAKPCEDPVGDLGPWYREILAAEEGRDPPPVEWFDVDPETGEIVIVAEKPSESLRGSRGDGKADVQDVSVLGSRSIR